MSVYLLDSCIVVQLTNIVPDHGVPASSPMMVAGSIFGWIDGAVVLHHNWLLGLALRPILDCGETILRDIPQNDAVLQCPDPQLARSGGGFGAFADGRGGGHVCIIGLVALCGCDRPRERSQNVTAVDVVRGEVL